MEEGDESNPWTTLNERVAYENPWIKVEHHDVLNPAGGDGIYGKVHFKNLAIGVIPIDENDHTWLVGQFRYPLGYYSWEIPEGGGPLGIDPLDSAKRELLEECGLVASQWSLLIEMDLSNSVSDEKSLIYVAEGLEQREAEPEDTEQLKIKYLPVDEAIEMVHSGIIRDSMSVAGLLRLQLKRLEK